MSVVVPVFNAEKYLDRCIESIINQTYQNIEIILINDGSTDSSPYICDKWASLDHRIRVIHKKNEGLGRARNTGIDESSGQYICFIDSDDYIAQETIEKCCLCLTQNQAEIVCFGYKKIGRNGKEIDVAVLKAKKEVYVGNEVVDEFLPELIAPESEVRSRFYMSAWAAMFSLDVIRRFSWKFVSEREIIAEDIFSLLSLYHYVTRVTTIPEALYYYCENDHSITRSYRRDRYERIRIFYSESLKLADTLQYGIKIKERLAIPYLSFTIGAMKQEISANQNRRVALENIKKIVDDDLFQNILRNTPSSLFSRNWKIFFKIAQWKQYKVCYFLLKIKG